eukprot:g20026.t1
MVKLLEKVLGDKTYMQLEVNELISYRQYGFVLGRSCFTNMMIEFFEKVTKMIEGKAVDVAYIDFSKAFDKVPHGKEIQKVKSHGIG